MIIHWTEAEKWKKCMGSEGEKNILLQNWIILVLRWADLGALKAIGKDEKATPSKEPFCLTPFLLWESKKGAVFSLTVQGGIYLSIFIFLLKNKKFPCLFSV